MVVNFKVFVSTVPATYRDIYRAVIIVLPMTNGVLDYLLVESAHN